MTTTFLNLPPHFLPSSTPQLHRSLVPPVDKIPPHLLPSSTPHLLNSVALWYPQWTKYLLTSSPPQLRRFLVPPVDKIPPHLSPSSTPPLSGTPSGQNTSSPPQLHHSLAAQVSPTLLSGGPSGPQPALWRSKWTKSSSPPQLRHSLAPQVAPTCSLAAQVDKIPPLLLNFATLWRPKCRSLTPLVALSGASCGNLLCSLAPLAENDAKKPFYTTQGFPNWVHVPLGVHLGFSRGTLLCEKMSLFKLNSVSGRNNRLKSLAYGGKRPLCHGLPFRPEITMILGGKWQTRRRNQTLASPSETFCVLSLTQMSRMFESSRL